MKTIRSLMTLAGLSLVLFALGITGAKAQGFTTSSFSGTFTLPAETHWGKITLPAGDYSLRYGQPFLGGIYAVAISDQKGGINHGMVLPLGTSSTSARKNALVCVREGNVLVVRSLEIAGLGTSIKFAMPRGAQLMAHKGNHQGYTQVAEAPMLIQRVPLTLNAK